MTVHISIWEILERLVLTVFLTGLIGYDREQKNHPAGMRTYILVGVGACVIALIQKDIGYSAFQMARKYPQYAGMFKIDDARLIAQVVSGIGFIGAGTIIIQRRNVLGLTSAATIWAVAGLGLAVGMGDYKIALAGTAIIFLVLTFLKRIIHVAQVKKVIIEFKNKFVAKKFIHDYFHEKNIKIKNTDFHVIRSNNNEQTYTNTYSIELPRELDFDHVIDDLSLNKNILEIQTEDI